MRLSVVRGMQQRRPPAASSQASRDERERDDDDDDDAGDDDVPIVPTSDDVKARQKWIADKLKERERAKNARRVPGARGKVESKVRLPSAAVPVTNDVQAKRDVMDTAVRDVENRSRTGALLVVAFLLLMASKRRGRRR